MLQFCTTEADSCANPHVDVLGRVVEGAVHFSDDEFGGAVSFKLLRVGFGVRGLGFGVLDLKFKV